MAEALGQQKDDRLAELERKLREAEEAAEQNIAAAQILNGMLENGDAMLEADGSVSVSKQRPDIDQAMEQPRLL